MNIRLDSSGGHALYASDNCPFCGRPLPAPGACACGVWERNTLATPSYLIRLTAKGPELARDSSYFVKQYALAKAEQAAKTGEAA